MINGMMEDDEQDTSLPQKKSSRPEPIMQRISFLRARNCLWLSSQFLIIEIIVIICKYHCISYRWGQLTAEKKKENSDVERFMIVYHPSFCSKLHWSDPLLICTERFLHILPSMDSDWINLEPEPPIARFWLTTQMKISSIKKTSGKSFWFSKTFLQSVISNSCPTCPWSSCIWRWAFAYPGVCKVLTFAQSFSSNVCADFKSPSRLQRQNCGMI